MILRVKNNDCRYKSRVESHYFFTKSGERFEKIFIMIMDGSHQ
jgi:hypothetical protein